MTIARHKSVANRSAYSQTPDVLTVSWARESRDPVHPHCQSLGQRHGQALAQHGLCRESPPHQLIHPHPHPEIETGVSHFTILIKEIILCIGSNKVMNLIQKELLFLYCIVFSCIGINTSLECKGMCKG